MTHRLSRAAASAGKKNPPSPKKLEAADGRAPAGSGPAAPPRLHYGRCGSPCPTASNKKSLGPGFCSIEVMPRSHGVWANGNGFSVDHGGGGGGGGGGGRRRHRIASVCDSICEGSARLGCDPGQRGSTPALRVASWETSQFNP